MSRVYEHEVCDRRLAFFCSIVASLSHEMNNVFAVVTELSGLIDDLLTASSHGRPLDPEKLKRTIDRISVQIGRGKDNVRQLNRFAHCSDHSGVQLDAREAVDEIGRLCQRFARLRRLKLEVENPNEPVQLIGCPFDLQHLIYRCIEVALETAEEGSVLRLSLASTGDGARVVVDGDCASGAAATSPVCAAMASLLAEQFGGSVRTDITPTAPFTIVLTVPEAICGGHDTTTTKASGVSSTPSS